MTKSPPVFPNNPRLSFTKTDKGETESCVWDGKGTLPGPTHASPKRGTGGQNSPQDPEATTTHCLQEK